MKEIDIHKIGGLNEVLKVEVLDEKGEGGACHEYLISSGDCFEPLLIKFQKGPLKEHGVNGVSNESLLAVVLDRLADFQNGPFPSEQNLAALHHVTEALATLKRRTKERTERGVEGTNVA